MDLRKRRKHSVAKLPLGTTRWRHVKRADGSRFRVKVIKVHHRGPQGWVNYARWVYERHHGPVPKGKRVIHRDGDLTNFDPTNLVLGTAADVLWVHCHKDPRKSAANRRACAAGTARHNRQRAAFNRVLRRLRTRWYAVDLERREILNRPRRSIGAVVGRPGSRNGRDLVGWRLGWDGLPSAAACILAALVDAGPSRLTDLAAAVADVRRRLGVTPPALNVSAFRSAGWLLVKRGLAERVGRGRYRATAAAIDGRGPVCPFVFVRGAELTDDRFREFAVVDEPGALGAKRQRGGVR